jgi:hypothetical protein
MRLAATASALAIVLSVAVFGAILLQKVSIHIQRLPRRLQTQPLRFVSEACRGPSRIEQCNIAHSELHALVVLGEH